MKCSVRITFEANVDHRLADAVKASRAISIREYDVSEDIARDLVYQLSTANLPGMGKAEPEDEELNSAVRDEEETGGEEEEAVGGYPPGRRPSFQHNLACGDVVRAYHGGECHEVVYRGRQGKKDLFEYRGRLFPSLSGVAMYIVGYPKSGPDFFGLQTPHHQRKKGDCKWRSLRHPSNTSAANPE